MRARVAVAAAVVLVLAAAGSSLAQTGTQQMGELVFVNGFTSGGPVDYRVDGEVVAPGVEEAVVTSAVNLMPGDYEVTATEPGDAGAVIVVGSVTLAAGRTTLFANHLDVAGESISLVADVTPSGQATSDDDAEFVAFHAARAADVSYRISGEEAQKGLTNGASGRTVIGAGRHSLAVVLAGEGRELARAENVEVDSRETLVALLVGSEVPPDDGGFALVTFTVPPAGAPSPTPGARAISRIAGPDRITTAVAISEEQFPDGAGVVYLARADQFADAVAGGSLTAGPVLLVPQCGGVPDAVAVEIDRLDPETVTALGGDDAVCEDTLRQAAG